MIPSFRFGPNVYRGRNFIFELIGNLQGANVTDKMEQVFGIIFNGRCSINWASINFFPISYFIFCIAYNITLFQ